MGQESRNKISRVSIKFEGDHLYGGLPIRPTAKLQRLFGLMRNLKVLVLNLDLETFGSYEKSWDRALLDPNHSERDKLAARYVSGWAWQGLETRIPFQERKISLYFLNELKKLCGEENVRVRLVGRDRYAGNLVHAVIAGQLQRSDVCRDCEAKGGICVCCEETSTYSVSEAYAAIHGAHGSGWHPR